MSDFIAVDVTFSEAVEVLFTEEDFYEGTPEEFPLLEELAFESSVPVLEAEKVNEVNEVNNPIMEANKALEESQKRLAFIKEQAILAAQEAAILDEVREVNNLVRKTVLEMGDQRLLPQDMERRREAAVTDSDDILTMFKDLGF